MKLILFFCLFILNGCYDNLTLNQITFNKTIKNKVTIEGHVNKPGLYLLDEKDNLNTLIKKAGGYKWNAQELTNNFKIKDNMKIFINSKTVTNKINLNLASTTDLIRIKGIGPKLADKIITYRQKYGNYKSISDLMNIKGIKEKLFNKIYEYLTI